MPKGQPNILVIWGDDIGITNLSCYSDGLMGYRTPNIDRIADEGMRFTDAYGEQSCTAGRAAFITGQSVFRTGLSKVGLPGSDVGLQPEDPDDRRAPQGAGLRDRAVRQEPPRGQERVPADGARLRRVLREPLPPERRGGSRGSRLPGEARLRGLPRPVRAARRASLQGDDEGRPERAPALGTGRQAADRGHGPADAQAHGDLRRRVRQSRVRLHRAPAQPAKAVLLLGELHPHALRTHTKKRSLGRPAAGSRPTTTRCSTTTGTWARSSTCSTGSGSPRTRSSCTAPTTART